MKSNEFVKYIGIDKKNQINTPYFKRIVCNDSLTLTDTAPPMKELVSVAAKATLTTAEQLVLKDTTHAVEHRALVGGHIHLSFQYATPNPRYALYSGDHFLHFGEYITLPHSLSPTIQLYPSIRIEDIFTYAVDSQILYYSVMLLLLIDLG